MLAWLHLTTANQSGMATIVSAGGEKMYKILIVEDDQTIAQTVAMHLEKWNYKTKTTEDLKNVLQEFLAFEPELVILDIMLPFFNGFYWCQKIREVSKVPIVFLSSANDNMNIVMAMNMGADEFIEKPFDLTVLTAKVQALLRRTYSFGGTTNAIEYKGALLNLNDAVLTYQEQRVELTKMNLEFYRYCLKMRERLFQEIRSWNDSGKMIRLWTIIHLQLM